MANDLVICIDDRPCQCKLQKCGGAIIEGLKKGRVYRVIHERDDFKDGLKRIDVGLPLTPNHNSSYIAAYRFKPFNEGEQIPAIIAMIKQPHKLDITTA